MNTKLKRAPDVIVSDVHHRITGVSSTCRAVTPLVASQYSTLYFGKNELAGLNRTGTFWRLVAELRECRPSRGFYIWHARRNNEMQMALFAKHVLRLPIKIVFTSSAIRLHSWWPRKLIGAMDRVIATSTLGASFVDAHAVVPHGVDLSAFTPGSFNKETVATKNNSDSMSKEPTVVGISGRIRPEKGTDILVDAMLPLLQKEPQLRLRIAGAVTSKYAGFAKALKEKLSSVAQQVDWLGEIPIDEMCDFYRSLDIVCAPARYEGYGVVPLEAMACATAVVASRTGAYPDMIEPSIGRLVDINSVEQLRGSLRELIGDRRRLEGMKLAAVDHVKRFDLKNEARGIAAVYESLWNAKI